MDTPASTSDYPVQLDVAYPDRPLNRLTTFFRPFAIIPIAIVLATVAGATQRYSGTSGEDTQTIAVSAGGLLFAGPLLMILFREKYPRWWFDWNLQLTRFSGRVTVYAALLDLETAWRTPRRPEASASRPTATRQSWRTR